MEKTKKITQKELVLRHLKDYNTITSMEAFNDYGITRLSHIIYMLREDYEIRTATLSRVNRYGNNVNYGLYALLGKKHGKN